MVGYKKRMGQDWRPNKAITVELMAELMKVVEQKAVSSTNEAVCHKWVMGGGYFCLCYVLSLRSSEGLLADLEGMLQHFDDSRAHFGDPVTRKVQGRGPLESTSHALRSCNGFGNSGEDVDAESDGGAPKARAKGRTHVH